MQLNIDTNKCFLRYILEARKRALAKKKKLRTLGKRARSADSEDEMEEDGNIFFNLDYSIFYLCLLI